MEQWVHSPHAELLENIGLHGLDVVPVITEDAGQRDLLDLPDLSFRERNGLIRVAVEIPVALFRPQELIGDDARERWSHDGASGRHFRKTANNQVNVLRWLVHIGKGFDGLHGHEAEEVVERVHGLQAAEGSVGCVARQTVVPATLDVQTQSVVAVFAVVV